MVRQKKRTIKGYGSAVNQLLVHGRWFSPGTPDSSTTKTGRHDIAEILLKMALNTIKSNQVKSWLGTNASISGGVIFDSCANTYPLSEMMCILLFYYCSYKNNTKAIVTLIYHKIPNTSICILHLSFSTK
jgi:hypothetical protein